MEGKDPIIELNRRAMEHIWNAVKPKDVKDGVEYITYVKTDIPFLYYSGLVDTQRWSREQWEKAFEDCLGEDGKYWVSHEKMISLGRFRYCKVVSEPFDPLKMRTGKYSAERLWQVFEKSVIPSCSLPESFFKRVYDILIFQKKSLTEGFKKEYDALKKKKAEIKEEDGDHKFHEPKFLKEDGKEYVFLDRDDLARLKEFLDTYPSPRRKLEIMVQETRMERLKKMADVATSPQQSSFESGKDFRDVTKKDLKDLLVKASENATAGRKPMDEVLNLKELQKKRPTKY